MKKLVITGFLLLAVVALWAQVDESLAPKSFSISPKLLNPLQAVNLPPLDMAAMERLDKIDAEKGNMPKFSRSIYTSLSLDNSGSWSEIPDGRIWRLKISSQGALALIPFFDKFYLPAGATLHVYMPEKEEVLGAFTSNNNSATGYLSTGLLHGETLILEYYEPDEQRDKGQLHMHEVGYAYRMVPPLHKSTDDFGEAENCEVNVNCTEGAAFQNQSKSVVRILVQSPFGQGWCSGALINNVRQDCTPYLLSAEHCSEGATVGQMGQWVFYFLYESPNCFNPVDEGTLGNKVITGCTQVASSADNGGDTGSDFLLLLLNSTPANNFNAFYAGWTKAVAAPTSGACIHHPNGDIKKISTFSTTAQSSTWGGNVTNTHWRVRWANTDNGFGVTEPGSSGGPLFNSKGLIVGHLTGGDSYCATPTQPDLFGKVSFDWLSNGTPANERLGIWLDPDSTGAISLNGIYVPCAALLQNDAGIPLAVGLNGNYCTNTITPKVVLQNFGANVLTMVTINYTIDGTSYQYNWNGTLEPVTTTIITLPDVTLSSGNHTFSASTANPNNTSDANNLNDGSSTTFSIAQAAGLLNLYLKTDNYGTETSWEITDGGGNVLFGGGPYRDTNNGETFNIPVCLSPGCYKLTLYDSFGDGMNGDIKGDMELTGQNGSLVYAELNAPNFGKDEVFDFCVAPSGIEEENQLSFTVFPNPNNGQFNVSFENTGHKTLKIFDAVGKEVLVVYGKEQFFSINLNNQAAGVYILQAEISGNRITKKLVVK